jgi:hypothetical protein
VNLRRGLFRVWVVTSLLWFIGWLWYVLATCETKYLPGSAPGEPWKEYVKFCHTGLGEWMKQVRDFTIWDYAAIGVIAVGVPIAALMFGVGALWAAEGFRTRTPPAGPLRR